MCGIAGQVGHGDSDGSAAVRAMVAQLARRGPDSEGIETWPGAVLGHRRLAILDLSPAGAQPMLSEDRSVGVVFNGCIYNFLELRAELEKRGHRFRSRCDTEVILRGYREWGIDAMVARMRGMFAIGIWDALDRRLTLVRDRLGVKPLAYAVAGGRFAFASTVAALRAAGFGGAIDPQAVLEFLEFGYVTEARSIYDGIAKVAPATILEWQDGRIAQRQYWTPPGVDAQSNVSFEEAVEETERLLLESVKLRLISDVPVGALLSAGIDSTLVCWAMREANAHVTAFTVRAAGDASDESVRAAATARRLGIRHEIVEMPESEFPLDEFVAAYGEPFACESGQAILWLSAAVKRKATVLLTGDGGDDVFLGYQFFKHAWTAQRLAQQIPAPLAYAWRAAERLVPGAGSLRRIRNFVNYATGGLGPYIRAHDGLPYFEDREILGPRLAGRELPLRRIPASLEAGRRLLADAFAHHRRIHFTSEFMPKVDGATMYFSLEARSPFLDHKLWEWAAALPYEIRFHGGALKAVLREIARRRVGADVAAVGKQGFTVPVERWLAGRWMGMLDCLRSGTLLEADGWVRRGSLDAPLRQAIARGEVPRQLWRLVVLEQWLRRNGAAPRPLAAAC